MLKRPATKHINKDAKQTITINKLQKELFKEAAELSALTGARIAVVLESSNEKVYSFGTPSAESIVDNFLSGNPRVKLCGEQNAIILHLQSKVVELERYLVELKEMATTLEKAGNEFPQVDVAPQMPSSHTSPAHLGSSTGGENADADGGYSHYVGFLGY